MIWSHGVEQDLQALCIWLLDPGEALEKGWAASEARGVPRKLKAAALSQLAQKAFNSFRTIMIILVHTSLIPATL